MSWTCLRHSFTTQREPTPLYRCSWQTRATRPLLAMATGRLYVCVCVCLGVRMCSVVLHDHNIILFGGYTSDSMPSNELWALSLATPQKWTKLLAPPSEVTYGRSSGRFIGLCCYFSARYLHATVLVNDDLWIFGGKVNEQPSVRARSCKVSSPNCHR